MSRASFIEKAGILTPAQQNAVNSLQTAVEACIAENVVFFSVLSYLTAFNGAYVAHVYADECPPKEAVQASLVAGANIGQMPWTDFAEDEKWHFVMPNEKGLVELNDQDESGFSD